MDAKKKRLFQMITRLCTMLATGMLQQCLKEHDSCKKRATLAIIFSTDNIHIVRDLDHDDRMLGRLLWIEPGTGSEYLNLVGGWEDGGRDPVCCIKPYLGAGRGL
jgi:hypothetical protein